MSETDERRLRDLADRGLVQLPRTLVEASKELERQLAAAQQRIDEWIDIAEKLERERDEACAKLAAEEFDHHAVIGELQAVRESNRELQRKLDEKHAAWQSAWTERNEALRKLAEAERRTADIQDVAIARINELEAKLEEAEREHAQKQAKLNIDMLNLLQELKEARGKLEAIKAAVETYYNEPIAAERIMRAIGKIIDTATTTQPAPQQSSAQPDCANCGVPLFDVKEKKANLCAICLQSQQPSREQVRELIDGILKIDEIHGGIIVSERAKNQMVDCVLLWLQALTSSGGGDKEGE
jgi:protein-arginine kinase activator protein McsA